MNNLACYYAIKDHKMRGYLSYLALKLENLVATWLVIKILWLSGKLQYFYILGVFYQWLSIKARKNTPTLLWGLI